MSNFVITSFPKLSFKYIFHPKTSYQIFILFQEVFQTQTKYNLMFFLFNSFSISFICFAKSCFSFVDKFGSKSLKITIAQPFSFQINLSCETSKDDKKLVHHFSIDFSSVESRKVKNKFLSEVSGIIFIASPEKILKEYLFDKLFKT